MDMNNIHPGSSGYYLGSMMMMMLYCCTVVVGGDRFQIGYAIIFDRIAVIHSKQIDLAVVIFDVDVDSVDDDSLQLQQSSHCWLHNNPDDN